jgi:hypothetical protein
VWRENTQILSARLIEMMAASGIPNGLHGVGYCEHDVQELTDGAVCQK